MQQVLYINFFLQTSTKQTLGVVHLALSSSTGLRPHPTIALPYSSDEGPELGFLMVDNIICFEIHLAPSFVDARHCFRPRTSELLDFRRDFLEELVQIFV